MSDGFNYQKRTVGDFFRDTAENGLGATIENRLMWGAMRMMPTDISDVTGATFTYLVMPDTGFAEFYRSLYPQIRERLITTLQRRWQVEPTAYSRSCDSFA